MTTVDTTVNWSLDYEHIPGCRLNTSSMRWFAVHPDKQWWFVGRPLKVNALVLDGTVMELTTVTAAYPAPDKACTAMAFISRKL